MEKDHCEAQVSKLVDWVTEGGPQQLHACNDHQKNVPAVEREREEIISGGPHAAGWVTTAHASWGLTVSYAHYKKQRRWVIIFILQRSKQSQSFSPSSHGETLGLKLDPKDSPTQTLPLEAASLLCSALCNQGHRASWELIWRSYCIVKLHGKLGGKWESRAGCPC